MTSTAAILANFESTGPAVVRTNRKDKTEERRKEERRKYNVRFVSLVIAVAFLAVYTVYSNMLLTRTQALITDYSAKLTEIESENVFLDYQIESMVSISNVEEYVENELGLVKISTAQIEYVNLEDTNKIVSEAKDDFGGMVLEFLNTVLDYSD